MAEEQRPTILENLAKAQEYSLTGKECWIYLSKKGKPMFPEDHYVDEGESGCLLKIVKEHPNGVIVKHYASGGAIAFIPWTSIESIDLKA